MMGRKSTNGFVNSPTLEYCMVTTTFFKNKLNVFKVKWDIYTNTVHSSVALPISQ
jgi:hypothetical protein